MPEPKLDAGRRPRTQQQRREETRRALLDAAVESLIDVGFARTTTLEVQRRAQVSRGALLHHFPSKAELLVAAIDHLAEIRAKEMKAFASQLPRERVMRSGEGEDGEPDPAAAVSAEVLPGSDARTAAVLDLLWQCFSSPFFQVTMELRTAARTDPELRRALTIAERSLLERIIAQSRTLFGTAVAEHPGLERALFMTLQLMIGAAMSSVLHSDTAWLVAMLDEWKLLFPLALAGGAASSQPFGQERKKLKGKR